MPILDNRNNFFKRRGAQNFLKIEGVRQTWRGGGNSSSDIRLHAIYNIVSFISQFITISCRQIYILKNSKHIQNPGYVINKVSFCETGDHQFIQFCSQKHLLHIYSNKFALSKLLV